MVESNVKIERLADDGTFPNNPHLPLLIYRDAIALSKEDPAATMENIFRGNAWVGTWRNGVYPYHHYHSTAHEVLGIARGTARLELGGPQGIELDVRAGDVLVLPAGTAHKNLGSSPDFLVVGAYPVGQEYDMNYGRPDERPKADQNIRETPLPGSDPLFGVDGPLTHAWSR